MASFIDLFNPSFFMFLGILVLVVAVIVIFFESRLREQNHKISSMLSIISTLAEDINTIHHHNTLSDNTRRGGEGSSTLIDVSDDDEEDESINQNIKILNITLNDIDNNNNSDSDSDNNSECSNNLEIESMDDSVASDEANLDAEFIEVLQEDEDESDDDDESEVKEVNNFSSELKTISIHLEEPVIDIITN